MKAKIHPKWFENAKVTCACGNSFEVGATVPELKVEVCSMCHPFYTGQMKYVDTAGRVEAFKQRRSKAVTKTVSKSEKRKIKKLKRLKEEMGRPDSLEAVRKQTRKKK
ncbi:50S ribosomal protein L31 [Patescibacteria group bacterium]